MVRETMPRIIFRISLDGESNETTKRIKTMEAALSAAFSFRKIGTAMWEGTVPSLGVAKTVIERLLGAVTEGGPGVSLDHFFVHIDGSDSPTV